MRKSVARSIASAVLGLSLFAAGAAQGAFVSGDLVVVQSGDGSAALTSTATAAFLKEYDPTTANQASPVSSIALPTAPSGSNKILTISGTSTSEGFLQLSPDGQYLAMAGYNAATGTASITASNSSTVNRVVGRIDANGNVDTTTAMTQSATPGNPRSAVIDGSNAWFSTSSLGIQYIGFGTAGTTTQLNTAAPTNTRVVGINSGTLYMSAASGTFQGVGTVSSSGGEPTTGGQTPTELNGFPTVSGPSPYDYVLADANTIYLADDRSTASGGGIQKWVFNGTQWNLVYTMTGGITQGVRGLCESEAGGVATLYATTTETSMNRLVSVTDTISQNSGTNTTAYTVLATASVNTAFRGVDFAPTPEPAALGIVGLLAVAMQRRGRKA